jgi:EAL domain-containing protein (putative c-di-GMP-specific phosphodiesterase class I)
MARLSDGAVVGTEALVRWAHPTLGLLLPEEFLPIAEDLGLMAEIDGWVLRQACLALGSADSPAADVDDITVNLSTRTLCHPALERLVVDALAAGGLEAGRLVIEVNETITAERQVTITDHLQRLRRRGVRVSLDDFGRGSSALSRLSSLPIDRLKIDATFLADIEDPSTAAPVMEAIVAMGHGLGLEVCAEGVETQVQRDFVERIGADLAQGWLLGRPSVTMDYVGASSRTA